MNLQIYISATTPTNDNYSESYFNYIFWSLLLLGIAFEWPVAVMIFLIIFLFISFFIKLFGSLTNGLNKISSKKIILNKKQLSINIGWSYKTSYLWKNIETVSTIKSKINNSTIYIIEIVLKESEVNQLKTTQIPIRRKHEAENLTDLLNYCCNEYKYEDIYTEDIDQIGLNQFLKNLRTTHYIKYKWYN